MNDLGFSDYVSSVLAVVEEHKEAQKVSVCLSSADLDWSRWCGRTRSWSTNVLVFPVNSHESERSIKWNRAASQRLSSSHSNRSYLPVRRPSTGLALSKLASMLYDFHSRYDPFHLSIFLYHLLFVRHWHLLELGITSSFLAGSMGRQCLIFIPPFLSFPFIFFPV